MTNNESIKIQKKRQKEMRIVEQMIRLYCKRHHVGVRGKTCPEYEASAKLCRDSTEGEAAETLGQDSPERAASSALCASCAELAAYAKKRSEQCPFMETKTFCSNCTVHCYKPEMREKIKTVMRYCGPRMLFHHPVMAIWHLVTFPPFRKHS